MTLPYLTTGDLAKQAGVNIETLRFYERKGLLPEPPRRVSGYRKYPLEDVKRIRFIKRAQELGFTLVEIGELLSLRVQPESTAAEVRSRAEITLAKIRRKIADLRRVERALQELTQTCAGHGPLSECPILLHLDGEF